jgi:hypothetical protein
MQYIVSDIGYDMCYEFIIRMEDINANIYAIQDEKMLISLKLVLSANIPTRLTLYLII